MRRKTCILSLLVAICLITLCSCGKKSVTEPGSENATDSQDFNSEDISGKDSSETQPDSPDTEYVNAEKVFTKDFDGFIMTIVTDKSEYRVGEPIRVTALLENTRDESIYLYYEEAPKDPKDSRFYSIELKTRVHIEDWYADPLDLYWNETAPFSIPIQPGERHVQSLLFQPCRELVTEDSASRPDLDHPAGPGVYDGNFFLMINQEPKLSDYPLERYDLDFSVTIKELDSGASSNRDSSNAQPDTLDTEYANGEQVFTKDFDGFLMTLVTDKSEYRVGEPIRVTASLENTRDETIYLYHPYLTTDLKAQCHLVNLVEMVRIEGWDWSCYDNWPWLGLYPDGEAVVSVPVQPGERHRQLLLFPLSYGVYDGAHVIENPAGPGVYHGNFHLLMDSDPGNFNSSLERYDLDFTVTIK